MFMAMKSFETAQAKDYEPPAGPDGTVPIDESPFYPIAGDPWDRNLRGAAVAAVATAGNKR